MTTLPAITYTAGAINRRLAFYIIGPVIASLGGTVSTLLALTDAQLLAIITLRWVLIILGAIFGAATAGYIAWRAAVDRSTGNQNSADAGQDGKEPEPVIHG